jgi:hypothetical protein
MPEKAKENEQPIVYDYHDASVHDVALRADILRGYEQFKVWTIACEASTKS